jgi:hypothetical protein
MRIGLAESGTLPTAAHRAFEDEFVMHEDLWHGSEDIPGDEAPDDITPLGT